MKYLHHAALISIAFSIVSSASHAAAPAIGGDTLLRWMQSKDERDGALAVGYIGGVREVTYQKEHCAGAEANTQEIVGSVRRVLEGMPKPASMSGSWFITTALKAKWPCALKKGEVGQVQGQAGMSATEKAAPNGAASAQSSTVTQLPGLSAAPSGQSEAIPISRATEVAPAERSPTREETEAYIVETIRSCDPGVSGVTLRATQLEYTSNRLFNNAIDLSKSSVSSTVSTVFFSCTSPGCVELSSGGYPASKHNQTTLNCSYTIAPRLIRALQHYQTFIGKQKPLF